VLPTGWVHTYPITEEGLEGLAEVGKRKHFGEPVKLVHLSVLLGFGK
jgi:hypothetical protein